MSKELSFKISSALKNIIGKELITDEFVAVFELVKNSFDANATRVEIVFENQANLNKGKITIKDNGKGMNEKDLLEKWLFVAYSAKREGTENDDYRNKIKINRVFAGAKGVGRFSCDRLGKFLFIKSVKDEPNAKIETLTVDWEKFEADSKKEFVDIKVQHEKLGKSSQKGTTLEITGLRDVWDRERLLKLKKSLAKLINPNQENDSKNFEIEVIAKSELQKDKETSVKYEKVNGLVSNEIFESLKIKTTSIKVEVSSDGKIITSTLQDRGDRIYTLKEKNTKYNLLHEIDFHLFQLNFNAKSAFKRAMGLESVKYGSVFMYKNSFRIYPFGEPGEDLLLIDRRKAQGYNRFLGNRDLIGRIEINGNQPQLRETSSRDGGFVKTETYNQLVDFFEEFVLKRLENYVVNVIKWGDEKINEETGELIHPELWAKDVKIQILELISGFIKSENVVSIDYDKNFLDIIERKQDKSVDKIIKNISKIGAKSNNPAIVREAARIGKVVKEVKADADKKEKENTKLRTDLEVEKRQSLFQKSVIGREKEDLLSLQHTIRHTASSISYSLDKLVEAINANASSASLINNINSISLEVRKIFSASNFVTKANFNMDAIKIKEDLIAFMYDYIVNVFKPFDHYIHKDGQIQISIDNNKNLSLPCRFTPLEITVIIDNLFSNSKKAGAKKVNIHWSETKDGFIAMSFKDDGRGISDKNVEKVFDFAFSTTDGSGIGLYHIKQIMEGMKGSLSVNNKIPKGAEFLLKFKK